MSLKEIKISGARVNNLKNIDLAIPQKKLVVITGLSGSGKSSLAFDTIYAEGQRRFMETMSRYARQFIGNLERPDVDSITGLCPAISIEQKTTNKNPRSTVGTITEIYDLLRLLYARIADAYSPATGKLMVKYNENQIIDLISTEYNNKSILILAPLIKGRKGHYRELFENMRRQGFLKVMVDGEIIELTPGMHVDRYKIHDIFLVADKLTINEKSKIRLKESVKTAFRLGKDNLLIIDNENNEQRNLSKRLVCPDTGISYSDPEPNLFSFNSPYGACEKCNGLGYIKEVDIDKIFPNKTLSIKKGGIAPLGEYKKNWIFNQIEAIGLKFGFTMNSTIEELSEEAINVILFGAKEKFSVKNSYIGINLDYDVNFDGIVNFLEEQEKMPDYLSLKKWVNSYMNEIPCPDCHGKRLNDEALHFLINEKNIAEVAHLELTDLKKWIEDVQISIDETKRTIANEIFKEISHRLNFIIDVGLDYLSLDRSAPSLSGGESQRIRLATQIGSKLIGVLYILDEPSIGLHQKDNYRLIQALKDLRDIGNSVIVVEHDEATMYAADQIIDIGPGAGRLGGRVVAQGNVDDIIKSGSITGKYLSKELEILPPDETRKGNGKFITIKGAKGHNLKNIDVDIPLNKLICVTGVSGSGKSSLINQTLYPVLVNKLHHGKRNALEYDEIIGIENIDKIIDIDQSPIGRTPRSNPATYTNVFSDIRNIFADTPQAKIRGYKAGRFSFNIKGGRCEECQGSGERIIEMNFLPSVHVKCEKCQGKRYDRETLEVRYRGKSISDVLDMTINQAVEFFENIPNITRKIKVLQDVGLGYLKLGQSSTTLSGGEAQRIKLVSELNKRDTGSTLYILDEPTTGLHFEDVKVLLQVINHLIDKGNTVIIIEHNLDVIKSADHIIDMGPGGGYKGGEIIVTGTPQEVKESGKGYTSQYL
ncbi:excinuclease ABC subunit UvrA [Bacteroidales bacterium OttesenSCG-928-K03]|nr:excinuclease ABC subunit UvrA [Odoribacter sp. OttesenSCG-928-L07]MDL2238921.1 excinuclease ABC subunit UvrA [Bacteroidales bacterium OttesenSCG-928-L14]MDL2242894.1 excinuclease ABC subunit UvrA [Bacteroidales bacterium OttesenSCG-928-K03]